MEARRYAALGLGVMALLFATKAMPLNILDAEYSEATDEIIFTVSYRGTHPHRSFSVAWLECQRRSDGSLDILGIVQSSDPDDSAEKDFRKTERISMTGFPCRPATVFIGGANPHFRRTVEVPAAD